MNMKSFKKFLLVMMVLIPSFAMGQISKPATPSKISAHEMRVDSLLAQIDTLIMINNQLLEHLEINPSLKNRYKLYGTENMYTLLELDTKTGKIKQVQWSLDSDSEGTFTINNDDLSYGYGYGSGSFELYPTKNMYQFVLIDKTDGRKWHVQWGTGGDKSRWIRRIY